MTAEGLQEKAKNLTAITTIVSSIDITDLQPNDLRAIVSMSFGGSRIDGQQSIYAVIPQIWNE